MADSTSFSLRADIAAAVIKIDEIKAVVDAIAETDFAVLETKLDAIKELINFLTLISGATFMSAATDRSSVGTTHVKKKEFTIGLYGAYSISLQIKSSIGGKYAYVQIYKNDSPFGSPLSNSTTEFVTKSIGLSFALDDTLSVYIYHQESGGTCYIRGCSIAGSYYKPIGEVVMD